MLSATVRDATAAETLGHRSSGWHHPGARGVPGRLASGSTNPNAGVGAGAQSHAALGLGRLNDLADADALSIPTFRRVASFVGLDRGFDIFNPSATVRANASPIKSPPTLLELDFEQSSSLAARIHDDDPDIGLYGLGGGTILGTLKSTQDPFKRPNGSPALLNMSPTRVKLVPYSRSNEFRLATAPFRQNGAAPFEHELGPGEGPRVPLHGPGGFIPPPLPSIRLKASPSPTSPASFPSLGGPSAMRCAQPSSADVQRVKARPGRPGLGLSLSAAGPTPRSAPSAGAPASMPLLPVNQGGLGKTPKLRATTPRACTRSIAFGESPPPIMETAVGSLRRRSSRTRTRTRKRRRSAQVSDDEDYTLSDDEDYELPHRRTIALSRLRALGPSPGSSASGSSRDRDRRSAVRRRPRGGRHTPPGVYSRDVRNQKIKKYYLKKLKRGARNKIKYACRKRFADLRPRVHGRFVKTSPELTAKILAQARTKEQRLAAAGMSPEKARAAAQAHSNRLAAAALGIDPPASKKRKRKPNKPKRSKRGRTDPGALLEHGSPFSSPSVILSGPDDPGPPPLNLDAGTQGRAAHAQSTSSPYSGPSSPFITSAATPNTRAAVSESRDSKGTNLRRSARRRAQLEKSSPRMKGADISAFEARVENMHTPRPAPSGQDKAKSARSAAHILEFRTPRSEPLKAVVELLGFDDVDPFVLA